MTLPASWMTTVLPPSSPEGNVKSLVVAVHADKGDLKHLRGLFGKGVMPYLYDLKTFDDPIDAALYIGDTKPAAVLLDLHMSRLSGLALAERIKEISPLTSIIVIADHTGKENMALMENCSVDGILAKPVDQYRLKTMLAGNLKTARKKNRYQAK